MRLDVADPANPHGPPLALRLAHIDADVGNQRAPLPPDADAPLGSGPLYLPTRPVGELLGRVDGQRQQADALPVGVRQVGHPV